MARTVDMLARMDPLVIAILFFALAAALAAADLFVPSGGTLAVASLLAAMISVYSAFRSSQTAGFLTLVLMLVAIPIFITVAIRIWPHTPIGRRIVLKTPSVPQTPVDPVLLQLQGLVGQVGTTQNSLMPCGLVRIEHRNYNAVVESGVIEAGENVEVIGLQQRNLVVRLTKLAPAKSSKPVVSEPERAPESLLDRPAEELGLDSLEG